MSTYYYVITFDPHPSTSTSIDYVGESLKTFFPEHWHFAGNTWVMRSEKSEHDVQYFLHSLLPLGRSLLIAIPEDNQGHWYTYDDNAPSWLRTEPSTPSE